MGSVDTLNLPVQLESLQDVKSLSNIESGLDHVAETIWAITSFIYTADSEVCFLKFTYKNAEKGSTHGTICSELYYDVDDDSSAATVGSSRKERVFDQAGEPQVQHDTLLPSFTQVVKKVALLFTDGMPSFDYVQKLQASHQNLIILHIAFDNGSFVRSSFLDPRDYSSSLDHIGETIQKVAQAVVSADWASPLGQLSFLGTRNWQQICSTSPNTSKLGDSVLGGILLRQSQERPDSLAIESWDGTLTYAQLHDQARRMAAFLLMSGLQPEDRVGIYMKKSKRSMVAIWGILMAGCTGVPLDIRNPPKRTESLLQRANAQYVVVDEWTKSSLDDIEVRTLPCTSDLLDFIDSSDTGLVWPKVTPTSVAFVLFTSGSTGIPKGVVIEHGPLYASILEIARELFIDSNSKVFQFSPFVSDVSTGDIFATLLAGGLLFVPSEEQRLDSLPETLQESNATHAGLTSSVMSQVEPHQVPHLQYMIAVGEALSKDNLIRWSPHAVVISAYGITETLVFDSFASPEHLASDYRNIGMARGPCLWVTNINDPSRVMPVGAVGEIVIEGPLLAREYMGAPELTAARFIQAPKWLRAFRGEQPNHRCYRSGDYGIRNPDGTVLYLGRADNQVKIRGQRVELNEIEHNLLACNDDIHQVAIELVRLENRALDQALIAFIQRPDLRQSVEDAAIPTPLHMDDISERLFLDVQSKLLKDIPNYMVPTLFVPINHIPKGALGKRDRNTLKKWGATLSAEQLLMYRLRRSKSAARAAGSPEEELLLELWAKVLKIPHTSVRPDDHFLQLGGDSIKAIQLVASLRAKSRKLAVSDIFQKPELSEQAKIMTGYSVENGQLSPPKPFSFIPSAASKDSCLSEAARVSQISPEFIEDMYPATPIQEALMAISSHRKDAYSYRVSYEIPSSIDLTRFKTSWDTLLQAEPIFRTRLVTLPNLGTWQVVIRSTIDWHENMTLAEYEKYDQEHPLAYGTELCRYAIIRDATTDALHFVWSAHHTITDGWSRVLMFDEIKYIYQHGSARQRSPFTHYIHYLTETDNEDAIEFWKDQFPDTIEPFPALPDSSYKPDATKMQTLDIALKRPSSSKITTSTLVQAAWALVTSFYSNTEETLFGLTLSGRDVPAVGVEETMGVTITTVPVRISYDSTSSIAEYVEEVQEYISQVKQHQQIGLHHIARLSEEARSATTFQSLLVVQPADDADENRAMTELGLELKQKEERDTMDYLMTLQVVIHDSSLQVTAYFDENVIPAGQMRCVLALFQHIVGQLATESDEETLHELDRMSPHDQQLLSTLYARIPPMINETLHGIFETRTNMNPDALALESSTEKLTYAEVNRRANALAKHFFKYLGGKTEPRAILCFKKSTIPIITMLAMLKIGGVCASINPERPIMQLAEMSKDVDAAIVLCDDSFVSIWEEQKCVPTVLGISDSLIQRLASPSHDLEPISLPTITPDNASFIIYTSGTSGKPKASVLEHRHLATGLGSVADRIGLDSNSRTLQFSAYTFDAHILEIITTLGRGGCVCVISDHERMNCLADTINKRRVNFALLTKTVGRLLDPEDVPTLQKLILSGEPNGRQDYQRWAPHVRLFNGLGPSECTPLVSLTKQCVAAEDNPSNIGSSLACRIWITNHRRPDLLVPVGCVGEMTIEGPCIGRGYVNRPKENAAAFILDPAWSRDGRADAAPRRFYRSGDLAKMNSDGSITFIGRADSQVKIHGQRVELGEIEDHLRRQSSAFASSAVEVLTVSSRGGASVLATFCTRENTGAELAVPGSSLENTILTLDEDGDSADVSQTRAIFTDVQVKLLRLLPQYMVPAVFIPVEKLPINASGKLERKKLHQWVAELPTEALGTYYLNSQAGSAVPETPMQKCLQALWAKVLRVPLNTIYMDDNFFRLGGDSVLSMQLIALARAEGISMTVADVFKAPLLCDMALTMTYETRSESNGDESQQKTPLQPFSTLEFSSNPDKLAACIRASAQDCGVAVGDIEDIYPCTPTQEALMAVSSHRPKAYTYEVALKLPSTIDVSRFKAAWEGLLSTYAIYRTRIVFRRGVGSLQVVLRPSTISWQASTAASWKDYLETDGRLYVEYGSDLCKFALLDDNDEAGTMTFVATLHHALYDGWSMMRTWQELARMYEQDISSSSDGLKETAITPFAEFFLYTIKITKKETEEFWKSQFPITIKSFPQLPFDGYMPNPKKALSASVACSKNRHESGATMATVIQTAWSLLLSKYSEGSQDVVFGLMQSGRDAPIDGITEIIGPTIATVPLRVNTKPSLSLQALLNRVQNTVADIRKYQQAGLQHIRELSTEASSAVQFQSLLTVHTMSDADIKSSLAPLGINSFNANDKEFLDLALTVECTIRTDSLDVLVNYDSVVVSDGEASFILRHLRNAINTVLNDDGYTKLQNLQLVSAGDIQVMSKLHALAAAQVPAPSPKPSDSQGGSENSNPFTSNGELTSDVEERLLAIWSQILNIEIEDIGLEDAFTQLGGHSITAMQIVSECRRIGIRLRVSTMLEKKSIKAIAPHCEVTEDFNQRSSSPRTATDGGQSTPEQYPIQSNYFDRPAELRSTYSLDDFPYLSHWSLDDLQDFLERKLPELGLEAHDSIIQNIYPCTSVQEGIILSGHQLTAGSPIYEMHRIWEFSDPTLVGAHESLPGRLQQTWETMVLRHSALRTGIVEHATTAGLYVQVALKSIPSSRFVQIMEPVADLSAISQSVRNEPSVSEEDMFWKHMPLLSLYRTKSGSFACCLRLSHAIVDDISLDLIMEEMHSLLRGELLSNDHAEFADYVEYERKSRPTRSLDFWSQQLDGVQATHLDFQSASAAGKGLEDKYSRLYLPRDAADGVSTFAQRMGVTQAAVIQAAWAVVLSVFTGQDDVCFGYIASDRDAPINGVEKTVGLLICMQICRVQMQGGSDITVNEVVQSVAKNMIQGLEHRNCSLALIQRKIGLGSSTLFDTCLTIRGALEDELLTNSFKIVEDAQKTEYAITLDAEIGSSAPEIAMSYKESLISPQHAKSIAGSLEAVLQDMVRGEYRPVKSLDTVGKSDLKLMEVWNTQSPALLKETIHGLVKQQMSLRPNTVATSGFDGEYTYAQLDNMADKLAAYLIGRGLAKEDRVILCFSKSTWPIIAMLAVFRAGGVCVPTDPQDPTSRLSAIAKDTEASIVLCDEANFSRFRGRVQYIVPLTKHFLLAELQEPNQVWEHPVAQPSDVAFVVYTPGSKEEMKGCLLQHGPIATNFKANSAAMSLTENSRVLQFASYASTASIFEMLAPLSIGGCVCIISDREHDSEELADAIASNDADWAMLKSDMARRLSPSDVPSLKTLILRQGLDREALELWCNLNKRLIYCWGVSECANSGCINASVARDMDLLQIGKAGGGCNIWITNQENPHRLAPIGAVGELLIQGPTLGLGYINQPEATKAAFVTNLDWSKRIGDQSSAARFCRTGYFGRFNHEGTVTLSNSTRQKVQVVSRVAKPPAPSTEVKTKDEPEAKNQPSNSMEADLQAVWSKVLDWPASKITTEKTFMSLGGDSLSAMQVVAKCRKAGIEVFVATILQKKTIAAIAPHCTRIVTSTAVAPPSGFVDGTSFNLSPIQLKYFEQQQQSPGSSVWPRYNQSIFCRVKKDTAISVTRLRQAFGAIVQRHGMLRARFSQDISSGQWQQKILPTGPNVFRFQEHSLGDLDRGKIRASAEDSSAALSITNGPVFSVDYFSVGSNKESLLFLAAHHLVVDIVSWQIILQDLNDVLQGAKLGDTSSNVTFQQWCAAQQADTTAHSLEPAFPHSVPPSQWEYWGISSSDNTFEEMFEETIILPTAATEQLLRASQTGASISDVLIGSLLSSFRQSFEDRQVPSVFIEHHGRESCSHAADSQPVEPVGVVGWFTVLYPIHIQGLTPKTPILDVVRRVKDYNKVIPNHGRSYFACRYLGSDAAKEYAPHEPIEIMVNYSGASHQRQSGKPVDLIELDTNINIDVADANPGARRWSMIQVEADVDDGRNMRLRFQLNRRMAHLDRVKKWISAYGTTLEQASSDLMKQEAPGFSLGDFPQLQISYKHLDELTTRTLPELNIDPKTQVEDILSLTSFQRVSLDGHCANPPRHWNQFYFDLPQDVDLVRLQQTCDKLLEQHSTLRSLFVKAPDGDFVQVIMKSMKALFIVYDVVEGDENVLERHMVQRLVEDLSAHLPSPGKPFVRFMAVQASPSVGKVPHRRLLMRLSHAQFDGYSRVPFIQSFAALYAGQAASLPAIGYGEYVRQAQQYEPAAKQYWSSLLQDSEPTRILETTAVEMQPAGSNYPAVLRLERNIPSLRALEGVTSATVFNTACALLLQKFTQSTDVVFGRLTSGRAALPARFQDLVGPCLNVVPVRVRFDATSTPQDVLQAIHQQHVETLSHESFALDNIIQHCTEWSPEISCSRFPVITQYLNQEKDMEVTATEGARASRVQLDDQKFRIHTWDPETVDPFPWSLCLGGFPSREGLRVSIAASSKWTDMETMEKIMQELLELLELLVRA